jgi:hypothetical protein
LRVEGLELRVEGRGEGRLLLLFFATFELIFQKALHLGARSERERKCELRKRENQQKRRCGAKRGNRGSRHNSSTCIQIN